MDEVKFEEDREREAGMEHASTSMLNNVINGIRCLYPVGPRASIKREKQ